MIAAKKDKKGMLRKSVTRTLPSPRGNNGDAKPMLSARSKFVPPSDAVAV